MGKVDDNLTNLVLKYVLFMMVFPHIKGFQWQVPTTDAGGGGVGNVLVFLLLVLVKNWLKRIY